MIECCICCQICCKKSILCRPRRGRCCLGGAVFVVLHFRHLRIALSSSEALRGVSTNSLETLSESGPPSLLLEGRAPNPQVLRCFILLTTESALRRIMSSDQRAPAAEGRVVASPEERDLHSPPLVTAHSVLLFSLPPLISRFLRGNSGQGPTESSWSSSSVSVPTGHSSAPQLSLFALSLSLLRSYKGLTVGDQTKATSILLSSQLPRRLRCRHGLRLKRPVSGSRCGRPRAQLVSSLFHHHTSPSLHLLPGHTRVKDTPLLFRLLSARCSLSRHLHQGLQNILAPVPPAFLIRPLPHLPLGNLSPVVFPGSPLHLSYRHRAAASCLSATVSSPASCRTASESVLLSIPDIILAALSWVRSSLSLLVLEIQGLHAGAAYSSNLP